MIAFDVVILFVFWGNVFSEFVCEDEMLEEYDTLETVGPTNDLATFLFEGTYFLVTPHYVDTGEILTDSMIWEYDTDQEKYVPFQEIQTMACHDVEEWMLDDDQYLFFANMKNLTDGSYSTVSPVYKLPSSGSEFLKIQEIETHGSTDSEHFFIGGDLYLLVANLFNGSHTVLNSQLYKWDTEDEMFELFQSIETNAAYACHEFTIGSDYYAAFASAYENAVEIYLWDGYTFEYHSSVSADQPRALTVFEMESSPYLYIGTEEETEATLFEWTGSQFELLQSLEGTDYKNREGTYFESGSRKYLGVANLGTSTTYDVESAVLKWDGTTFQLYQTIQSDGAEEWLVLMGPWTGTRLLLSEYGEFGEGSRRLNSSMYEFVSCPDDDDDDDEDDDEDDDIEDDDDDDSVGNEVRVMFAWVLLALFLM